MQSYSQNKVAQLRMQKRKSSLGDDQLMMETDDMLQDIQIQDE